MLESSFRTLFVAFSGSVRCKNWNSLSAVRWKSESVNGLVQVGWSKLMLLVGYTHVLDYSVSGISSDSRYSWQLLLKKSMIRPCLRITSSPSSSGIWPFIMSALKYRTFPSGNSSQSVVIPLLLESGEPNLNIVADSWVWAGWDISYRYDFSWPMTSTIKYAFPWPMPIMLRDAPE